MIKEGEIYKDIQVQTRNKNRLSRIEKDKQFMCLCIELIKNGIQYGQILTITTNDENKTIMFSNPTSKIFDAELFSEAMKTYGGEQSDSNFHEGLTLTSYELFSIRTGTIYMENAPSNDDFYQKVKRFDDNLEPINEWNVVLYLKDSYNEKKSQLINTIDKFILTGKKEKIILNGKTIKMQSINLDSFQYFDSMYYHFEIIGDRVKLLWRVTEDVYQEIPSTSLDNMNINGTIILTKISSFANDDRIELTERVLSNCKYLIERKLNELVDELKEKDLLKQFNNLQNGLCKTIGEITQISENKIKKVFGLKSETKIDQLKLLSKFCFTLFSILPSKKLKQISKPIYFETKAYPLQMMSLYNFWNICDDLNYHPSSMKSALGILFINGECGGLANSIDFIQDEQVYYVESSEFDLTDMRDLKIDGTFIYIEDLDRFSYYIKNPIKFEIKSEEVESEEVESEEVESEEVESYAILDDSEQTEQYDDNIDFESTKKTKINEIELFTNENNSNQTNDSIFSLVSEIENQQATISECMSIEEDIYDEDDSNISIQHTSDFSGLNQSSDYEFNSYPNEFSNDERETSIKIDSDKTENVIYKNDSWQYTILKYKRGSQQTNIPFLLTHSQYNKITNGKKVITKVTAKKWFAFKTAVDCMVSIIGKTRLIIKPVMFYLPNHDSKAFYVPDNGILAFNLAYFRTGLNISKSISADYILDIVCHELTHEKISPHNDNFIIRFHYLKELSQQKIKINGVSRYVRDHIAQALK